MPELRREWRRYMVVCANCGETVRRSNPSRTCSVACREALAARNRIALATVDACPVCGKVTPLLRKAGPLWVCSPKCRVTVWQRAHGKRDRGKYVRSPLLGSQRECENCQTSFTLKRRNARFCSIRCQERWHARCGIKGQRRRAKLVARRDAFNRTVGRCALCLTDHEHILPPSALGMMRRNKIALFHRDHIAPQSQGGADDGTNRRYLCWFCNTARMDMASIHDTAIAAAGKAFWQAIHQ